MRLRTVLRPGARKSETTGEYRLQDYISVPVVELYGTWTVQDCMPAEHAADLARWVADYERRKRLGIKAMETVHAPASLFSHAPQRKCIVHEQDCWCTSDGNA